MFKLLFIQENFQKIIYENILNRSINISVEQLKKHVKN